MRALVTRPAEDAAELAGALGARGVEPLIEPLLTIRPLADGAARLAADLPGAQAVLFTSSNGVRAFAEASARRDLSVYAVGDATAAAARRAGFGTVASAGGNVEDLARLVRTRLRPAAGALIHAAAGAVAGDLAGRLGAAGFALRRVVLYEAQPAAELGSATRDALRLGHLDLALFFSPRTAATFVNLTAAAGLGAACGRITAIALSPAVASGLEALAWRGVRSAGAPTQSALLTELDAILAEGALQKMVGVERERSV